MACLAGGAGRGLGFVFSSRREFSRHKCRYVCGLHPDITSSVVVLAQKQQSKEVITQLSATTASSYTVWSRKSE